MLNDFFFFLHSVFIFSLPLHEKESTEKLHEVNSSQRCLTYVKEMKLRFQAVINEV